LQNLEEHNISHLGITAEELQQVVFRGAQAIEKTSVAQTIDAAIAKGQGRAGEKGKDKGAMTNKLPDYISRTSFSGYHAAACDTASAFSHGRFMNSKNFSPSRLILIAEPKMYIFHNISNTGFESYI